jgi:hypothetical protein
MGFLQLVVMHANLSPQAKDFRNLKVLLVALVEFLNKLHCVALGIVCLNGLCKYVSRNFSAYYESWMEEQTLEPSLPQQLEHHLMELQLGINSS